MSVPVRLGVNVDHVATVRNARGGPHPDPLDAARIAQTAGAHGITAHLREDRRHIRDRDVERLKAEIGLPLNLEMAATDEMRRIALALKPHAACIVPEHRQEVTTEGGLDVAGGGPLLERTVADLGAAGVRVSLFVDPDLAQIDAAKAVGAAVVELHTGTYCNLTGAARDAAYAQLREAAKHAHAIGLEVHAGHGLDYETAAHLAALEPVVELNIGHFLIARAIFDGLGQAVRQMRMVIDQARLKALG